MSDLNQLLGDALERRASAAGPGLTAASVHLAVRRQRRRTATVTAVVAVIGAGVTGLGAVATSGHGASRAGDTGGTAAPTSATTRDGTVVEQLPWAGTTLLTLRRGAAEAPHGYAFCIGDACSDVAAAPARTITLEAGEGTFVGLAPKDTRTVTVAIGAEGPVLIPVAVTDDSTLPGVLFGTSTVTAVVPGPAAFSRTYRLTAYDGQGHQLASQQVVGSADLARTHPPVGRLAALPSYAPTAGLKHVAWTDGSGWACAGERAGSGTKATFGAFVCIPPGDPGHVALVDDDASNQYVVLRVPPTVTVADLRGRNGTVVRARLTDTGHGRLATFDLSVGTLSRDATVTCHNASGGVVLTASMPSLPTPAGTVIAGP